MDYKSEIKMPEKPVWKIRGYRAGALGLFVGGSSMMLYSPILGISGWMASIVMFTKADDTEKKYEKSLKSYQNPKIDVWAK